MATTLRSGPAANPAAAPAPTRRPLRARVSTGHVVMVVAGLLGALLTLQVLRSADDRSDVLALRHDVPAGEVITSSDLESTPVRVDSSVENSLIDADRQSAVVGAVATRSLHAGDLLNRHDTRTGAPGDGRRAMSIPIDTSRAAGGDLAVGDRVDVIATTDAGSEFIVTDAEVLRTGGGESSSGLRTSSDKYFIKIAVDANEATAIAYGLKNGTLDVVAATGAAPITNAERQRSGTTTVDSETGTADDSSSAAANGSSSNTVTGSAATASRGGGS